MGRIVDWIQIQGRKGLLQAGLVVLVAASGATLPMTARANPMREFVMSCSYGVLAGTLVGAATLAFADQPGESLNKIARGASIGLYAGILLGFYVVYGVPADEEEVVLPPPEDDGQGPPPTSLLQQDLNLRLKSRSRGLLVGSQLRYRAIKAPSLLVAPVITDRGLEGAVVQYALLKF